MTHPLGVREEVRPSGRLKSSKETFVMTQETIFQEHVKSLIHTEKHQHDVLEQEKADSSFHLSKP